jgi:hypothetical protein
MLFFVSPLDMPALTGRLAARLDATISGDMDVMLRYFDPRVFEAMLQIFPEERRAAFLGIAACWWYVDRCGQLVCVPSAVQDTDPFDGPTTLSAEEECAFVDASEPDQIAQLVSAMLPEQYGRLGGAGRYPFIQRHAAAAREFGIDSVHDAALYCTLVLLHGEQFAEGPAWSALLATVKTGHIALMDAVIRMEEEDATFAAAVG